MKRAVSVLVLCAVLGAMLGGCSFYREYLIGYEVLSITGRAVELGVQRWIVSGSGLFERPVRWEIHWGDGDISDNEDALSMSMVPGMTGGFVTPLSMARFWHGYPSAGVYEITIKQPGAPDEVCEVEVGE